MRWARLVQHALVVCLSVAAGGCAALRGSAPDPQPTAEPASPGPLPPDREAFAEALARYATGISYEWNRDGAAAASNFLRAAELDPDNEELQFRVALGLVRDQRGAEALELMERLARRRPNSERAQVWTAFVLRLLGRPEAAMEYYDRALRIAPGEPLPYLEKAALLARTERSDEAIALLEQGLRRARATEDIARMLAQLHVRRASALSDRTQAARAAEQALRALEPAVARGPRDEALLFQMAVLYKLAGRYESALEAAEQMESLRPPETHWRRRHITALFGREAAGAAALAMKELVNRQPDNPGRLLTLGHLLEQTGDAAGAEAAYRRARELAPDEPAHALRLGLLLAGLRRADEAADVLREALAAHPRDVRLLELLGYIEISRERPADALTYFDRAQALFQSGAETPLVPHFAVSHALAALQAGRADEAAQRLKDALAREPEFLELFARVLLREPDMKRRALGVDALRRLSELDSDNASIFVYLGLLASHAKRYEESVAAFARAETLAREQEIEEDILTPAFYFWYGAANERIGRIDEAARLFLRCIEMEPPPGQTQDYHAWVDALNYLAYMWAERGMELEKGLELVNRALAISPDNAAYIDTRGWISYMQGRYAEAREDIERALSLMPDDPTLADHMGDVYEKLGVIEEAIDWWSRSFVLDPANAAVAEKLERQGVDLAPLRAEAERRGAERAESAAPALLDPALMENEPDAEWKDD
jgi:tetratricopeptide (TPR) repeat protein